MEEKIKQDSYTIGTGKTGAIKLYFDLVSLSDEEVKKLCGRARGLAISLGIQV